MVSELEVATLFTSGLFLDLVMVSHGFCEICSAVCEFKPDLVKSRVHLEHGCQLSAGIENENECRIIDGKLRLCFNIRDGDSSFRCII